METQISNTLETPKSKFNDVYELYRYIYVILRGIPAPKIVNIHFENDVVRKNLVSTFYQSCAKMLGVSQSSFIYNLSILNLDFNLSISLKDLEYLYQYEFIPKI
jgi:hypothetical protein